MGFTMFMEQVEDGASPSAILHLSWMHSSGWAGPGKYLGQHSQFPDEESKTDKVGKTQSVSSRTEIPTQVSQDQSCSSPAWPGLPSPEPGFPLHQSCKLFFTSLGKTVAV